MLHCFKKGFTEVDYYPSSNWFKKTGKFKNQGSLKIHWNGLKWYTIRNISIDAKFGLLLTDFSAASKMCSRKIVNGRHFFYFWRFLSSRNQCEKQILLHFQRYSMYINNSNRLSYDTWHFTWKWLVGGNKRVKDSFLSLKNSLHDKYGSNP